MNKNEVMRLRVTSETKQIIKEKMEELGLTNFSEYATLKLTETKNYYRPLKREYVYQLQKIGNNLNQIAKELNRNKDGIIQQITLTTIAELQELMTRIYADLSSARKHE